MSIRFRDNPQTTLPELQRELKSVVGQLKDPVVLVGVALTTASTAFAHGLGFKPRALSVIPYTAGVTVSRSAASDNDNVYVKASAATLADVVVFP